MRSAVCFLFQIQKYNPFFVSKKTFLVFEGVSVKIKGNLHYFFFQKIRNLIRLFFFTKNVLWHSELSKTHSTVTDILFMFDQVNNKNKRRSLNWQNKKKNKKINQTMSMKMKSYGKVHIFESIIQVNN